MSGPLPVVVSALAAEQIHAAAEWWRANRPKAPTAFREDLDRAVSLLAIQPNIGSRARNIGLRGVRRVHLARIRYDLYYRLIAEPPHRVEILALWHASRGSNPPIRDRDPTGGTVAPHGDRDRFMSKYPPVKGSQKLRTSTFYRPQNLQRPQGSCPLKRAG